MSIKNMKFAFIGAGNIATAIVSGMLSSGLVPSGDIFVYDCDVSKYENDIMRKVNCCKNSSEAVINSDCVIFALKPGYVCGAAKEIAEKCPDFENKTYISVAAAVSSSLILNSFGRDVGIIRVMPNTPLLLGEGAVAIAKNDFVKNDVFQFVCRLFSCISEIAVMEEEYMQRIISVNGSSPAYVYLFYKALLTGALEQGIPEDKASPLILQSIKGAVKMIEKSGKDVDTLIKEVSSPNGTTLAALSVFQEKDFLKIVVDAMVACTKRAEEMAIELEQNN